MYVSIFRNLTIWRVIGDERRRVRVFIPLVLLLALCAAAVSAQAPSPPGWLQRRRNHGRRRWQGQLDGRFRRNSLHT